MSKVLIGNFKGPQGEQGIPGIQGEQGERGNRGSRWTEGTAITGTSTTPTVFNGTGISDSLAEDMYLNTDTGNAYRCTTGGEATVAKWVYACNLKGIKGDTGAKGDPGTAGPKGEKGDTGEQGPKGETPTVADNMTVAFTEAATRENISTGEKVSTVFGKIKKFFADLTAPAFAQMITSKEDLLAAKVTGYVPDAKAVADTYTELNGNLTYSTEETICGKWIDGRKIYRVVKQVTSNINTNIVALSLPTASRVIDIKGTIDTNENRTIPIYCTWETGLSIYAYYYQSEKNIYLNNKVGSGTAYIIVEYIK
jgi:hypothetical protein